jgi:hypothetical protein
MDITGVAGESQLVVLNELRLTGLVAGFEGLYRVANPSIMIV